MRFDNIRDIFTNTIVKDGQKYPEVDVARYGRDKTVFNFFDGLESYKREFYQEQGTDKTVQLSHRRLGLSDPSCAFYSRLTSGFL